MGTEAATSTASVLFTDLVGSTELRSRVGEEAADEIRRVHDRVVSTAIEADNGLVVKSLGDGLMAVFESAADAVAAAIGVQQAVEAVGPELPEPIAVRVGVSVGDVSVEDGDYFGTAVNEAARLCGAARGAQILAADLVRAMARGRGGFRFEPMGDIELKGLPDPVPTCDVGWDRVSSQDLASVPFPPLLAAGAEGSYIGRPDVRATLRDVWEETDTHGARTVLLVGEPGIGKTRTACELARNVQADGAVVLFGRCDDELRMPYQPFVEALDWQTLHASGSQLGRLPGELVRLVPDLADRCTDVGVPVSSDPRTEEHRLFEAVASWIESTARPEGLVLVLDDLQWATKPTLQMLMHVVRHAAGLDGVRLLVVGTYRDTDVDRSHPLSAMLGDLQRIDGVRRVPVDPLDADEVVELVQNAAGHPLDDVTRAVAIRTFTETEGNPFFVTEVLRHLIESGGIRFVDGRWVVPDPDQIDVPEGVRDVVGQRLSRLSETANDVLRAAAVIGREFSLDLVGDLAEIDEGPLLDAIDEASRARLVDEIDADGYRFSHALVRTSLYEEMSASRRRRMHRRVTDLYAKSGASDPAVLAHHAVEAGPRGGDLSDAIGYVLAAAEQARITRALAEAESLYRKALELLDEDVAEPGDRRWLLARCGIGEVTRDQGDPTFRETLLGVARDAVTAEDDELVVRAALSNTRGFISCIGKADEDRIELIEAALERVATTHVADQARLKALLASELSFSHAGDVDPERERITRDARLRLVDEAVALLDDVDDHLTEAWVLALTRFPDLVPDRWTTGLPRAQRAVDAADRCGDPNLQVLSRIGLVWNLLSRGEIHAAGEVTEEHLRIATEQAGPSTQWAARAMAAQFHLYRGDVVAASRENDAALELGVETGVPDAVPWWAAVGALLAWNVDGRAVDPELVEAMGEEFPGATSWRAAQAESLADAGRWDECRAVISEHGLDDLESQPKDAFWFANGYTMGMVVRVLGDADLARRLLSTLEPYADHFVHYCIAVNGPMRLVLAWLRAAADDTDGGIADLRWTLDWAVEQGIAVFEVVARVELAQLLVRRDGQGDQAEAVDLLSEARSAAERLEMTGWITRVNEVESPPSIGQPPA